MWPCLIVSESSQENRMNNTFERISLQIKNLLKNEKIHIDKDEEIDRSFSYEKDRVFECSVRSSVYVNNTGEVLDADDIGCNYLVDTGDKLMLKDQDSIPDRNFHHREDLDTVVQHVVPLDYPLLNTFK